MKPVNNHMHLVLPAWCWYYRFRLGYPICSSAEFPFNAAMILGHKLVLLSYSLIYQVLSLRLPRLQ